MATASSQGNVVNYGPQFAIDGEIAQKWLSFFHSDEELLPWLQVAFPNETKISSVKITNR
jgi:hypothetical protein